MANFSLANRQRQCAKIYKHPDVDVKLFRIREVKMNSLKKAGSLIVGRYNSLNYTTHY